jgi:hypothetical protein
MAEVKLIIDGARMAELLRGPAGPVFKHLDRRADIFQAKARNDAPMRTGCLRNSIHKRAIEEVASGLSIRIVSDTTTCSPTRTPYDLYIHEGADPHDIPNAFGYGPTFGIGGRFDGKFHPGNRAYKYLSRNLYIFDAK